RRRRLCNGDQLVHRWRHDTVPRFCHRWLSAAPRCCALLVAPPYWRGQLRYAVPSVAGEGVVWGQGILDHTGRKGGWMSNNGGTQLVILGGGCGGVCTDLHLE